jgi:hypothetical protein
MGKQTPAKSALNLTKFVSDGKLSFEEFTSMVAKTVSDSHPVQYLLSNPYG